MFFSGSAFVDLVWVSRAWCGICWRRGSRCCCRICTSASRGWRWRPRRGCWVTVGVRAVAEVAGVSVTTVRKSVFELEGGEDPLPPERVRRRGGGRKSTSTQDAGLVAALLALVEPDERGDSMSPLRWTTKSLRHLAEELTRQGHRVSAPTVGKLLVGQGFSLQANVKTLEGNQHPDRDAQFRYLNEQVK
jgi:transposase